MLGRTFDSVLVDIKDFRENDHVYFLRQRISEALENCRVREQHQLSEFLAFSCYSISEDKVVEQVTQALRLVFVKDQAIVNFLSATICGFNNQIQGEPAEMLKRKNDFQPSLCKKRKC